MTFLNKIVEFNELNKHVMASALEWKIFMEFCTVVLDEELAAEGMKLIDKLFKDAHSAVKDMISVKTSFDGAVFTHSIQTLNECRSILDGSLLLNRISESFKGTVSAYLFRKIQKHCEASKDPTPVIDLTHYLSTVDEQYQSLVKERSQVITAKEISKLKSKYWVALKEQNKVIDLNLNFIYKETSAMIKEMNLKRFPNIASLTLK